MKQLLRQWRFFAVFMAVAFAISGVGAPLTALAGTTGTVSGTIRDAATGAPIANVKVTAAAPSQAASTTTDARGFYVINGLGPDTYTVSFQAEGYTPISVPGALVFADQNFQLDMKLSKELKTIASVHAASTSNLVKSNQGSDVYLVSGTQLKAAQGGSNVSQTLYTLLGTVPGITVSGGIGAPRIRGGDTHDIGYEYDGIPIRERLFGLFTTNITTVGIGTAEVYTGGLPANAAGGGAGVINTVVKTGTYPAFGDITLGVTAPDYNHYLTAEYGGQSTNRRFSYYVGFGGLGSRNVYNYGLNTYPNLVGGDISGPVNERDIVGNFHYRPNEKNDFQFLVQNGVGDFNFDYLMARPSGAPPALSLHPCSGATVNGNSYFGVTGGTAPNGQACPLGFYWGAIPGPVNIWHHYSGLGKIQWNHTINDKSFFALRLAENFNQYIFDQPLADPNQPGLENTGDPLNISSLCPAYPYQPGSPVQGYAKAGKAFPYACGQDYQSFYGDRKSHMYFLSFDYTNAISENLTLRAGVGQEYDNNLLSYVGLDSLAPDGTYPNTDSSYSDVPTHVPDAYVDADIHRGKLLLTPGLFWSRIWYGAPTILGGSRSAGLWNPTFNGTYSFDPKNVLRFSYGNSSSFVGSAYIYRESPHTATGTVANPAYDPATDGGSVAPELVQSADMMFEHAFTPETTLRVGPYYENAIGYYESYKGIKSISNTGVVTFGPAVKSDSGRHHALGVEFALNHVSNRDKSFSYWLTGTYDNFWTTSTTSLVSATPLFTPLPSYFTNQKILTRNSSNPLFTGSFTGDYRSGRFDFMPEVFYQLDTFYNTGYTTPAGGNPVLNKNQIAGGWYLVNLSMTEKLGSKKDLTIGVLAHNIFEQDNAPYPCVVAQGGTGCAGINGPYSGLHNLTPGTYIYQPVANYNNIPRSFEFFMTKSF